ncbi:protein beta [Vibrio nigripulchritudo]|nr:protein beta [Vibrio nigripulchritudo]
MFNLVGQFYDYIPILALSPSEMTALEQLPDKDKNLLLPYFPLKGWTTSKELRSSMDRIKKSIGERPFIADIDSEFLYGNKTFAKTGEYPRQVFKEIHELLDPADGYSNWVNFVKQCPQLIPSLILEELVQLEGQIDSLAELRRGLVIRLKMKQISANTLNTAVRALIQSGYKDLMFVLDYEDIGRADLFDVDKNTRLANQLATFFPESVICISATSFPFSFAGSYRGELPIYERQLFNKIKNSSSDPSRIVYSDRGSARAAKLGGGSALPPPRIDYALKHDWRFIRKEYDDPSEVKEGEKELIYQKAAIEMIGSDYWNDDLRLWGTQMIEKTALGDKYGITSPNRATAVRINLHIYQQIHYADVIEELCTEEEWVD